MWPQWNLTGWRWTCSRRKKNLAMEISQVAFSGPERRVWRDDLALVSVSITEAAVATMGRGCWWRVCLVGYRCGVKVGTLGSGRGFTLGSDGVCTLGRDEGSLSIFWGRCGGGVGGVWTAQRRIRATCKYALSIGGPKDSKVCKDMDFLLDRMLMMSTATWRR